jgi:hypothetical protein
MTVWRKLKSMGSISVLQSIWILPDTDENKEEFIKLVEQIKGVDGQAITYIMLIKDEQENNTLNHNENHIRNRKVLRCDFLFIFQSFISLNIKNTSKFTYKIQLQ